MDSETINEVLKSNLRSLLDIQNTVGNSHSIMPWACPIPFFGDISKSEVATVGINPSNREFVSQDGKELAGSLRRFPTLSSLALENWSKATDREITAILESCSNYFSNNPYEGWFGKLEYILSGLSASYYFGYQHACHLDIIPFATYSKWGDLDAKNQKALVIASSTALLKEIAASKISLLILNGQSVVDLFQRAFEIKLNSEPMKPWTLPRPKSGDKGVPGIAYFGDFNTISNEEIKRSIRILGFNHNLQSSFGVTREVILEIRKWIRENSNQCL